MIGNKRFSTHSHPVGLALSLGLTRVALYRQHLHGFWYERTVRENSMGIVLVELLKLMRRKFRGVLLASRLGKLSRFHRRPRK